MKARKKEKKHPSLFSLTLLISVSLYSFPLGAIEFNTGLLSTSEKQQIDLSQFTQAGGVAPGQYLLDVHINDRIIPAMDLVYYKEKESVFPCLPLTLIKKIGLEDKVLRNLTFWHQEQCVNITAIHGINLTTQLNKGRIVITIPQILLKYADPNWVPKEQWDNGIPGLLLDYNLGVQWVKNRQSKAIDITSFGTTGVNAGAWRLRADYQYYENHNQYPEYHQSQSRFDWTRIYAFRPLPILSSKLTVGQLYLDSRLFESFRFLGVTLNDDERMLPPALRGFAPTITGIANSNSQITVSQQGRILYQTTVPAGPYVIKDLNSSVRGQVDIEVKGDDGHSQHYQQNIADLPYLTRPGRVRYNLALGKASNRAHWQGVPFLSGDVAWGMNNTWTLYGGLQIARQYQAGEIGIGRDLGLLGAMSADITHSQASLPKKNYQGNSFSLNWSKRFDKYNAEVTFAGYRFSQQHYMSMNKFLNLQNNFRHYVRLSAWWDDTLHSEKELYTLTLNKTFNQDWWGKYGLTTYLTYSHQNYWDSEPQDRYGINFSHSFDAGSIKNMMATVSAYHTVESQYRDTSAMFSLSVPMSYQAHLSYYLQNSNAHFSQNLVYSQYDADYKNNWQLSTGLDSQRRTQVSGYYSYGYSAGKADATASWYDSGTTSLGMTIEGGITATRYGVALHQNNGAGGGTRMFIDTNGVAGVPIGEQIPAITNYFGVAVVSDVAEYYDHQYQIDVNRLPDSIEPVKPVADAVLTEGAIGYRRLDVAEGLKILGVLRRVDGQYPPFGAQVFNQRQQVVGMVDDGGQIFLSGVAKNEKLRVAWGGDHQCEFAVPDTTTSLYQALLTCQ